MTISSQFLHQGNKAIAVPKPHDLLKVKGKLLSFLPNSIFLNARMAYHRHSHKSGKKVSPFYLYYSEKIVFIHIPKNAGTFINSIVYPSMPPETSTEINAHHSVQYLKKLDPKSFASMRKFAILRHPLERLHSAFNYLKFKTPFYPDKKFAENHLAHFPDFDTFCSKLSVEEFEDLLNWPHFQPQISFICDVKGTLLVDALTTFEGMDQGMPKIGTPWGKTWSVRTKVSSANLDNRAAMQLVEAYYAHDLRLWEKVHAEPGHQCFVA
ncbi:sulfotransferase family 2 domain-containing protein [Pelagibacterium sp.]|uniref:sulfotransferase family 2 domain-containing protein n=1 Tax=Pelagibacterium sp. TaxID=1967288 RepID=UPI003A91C9C4